MTRFEFPLRWHRRLKYPRTFFALKYRQILNAPLSEQWCGFQFLGFEVLQFAVVAISNGETEPKPAYTKNFKH